MCNAKLVGTTFCLVALAACIGLVQAQTADVENLQTLARWTFDNQNDITVDDSGNFNTLFGMDTTWSSDVPGGSTSTGSAYFNGVSAFMQTMQTLDLSAGQNVRVSWWQKHEAGAGIVWEHSANANENYSGLVGSTGWGPDGGNTAGVLMRPGVGNHDTFPDTVGSWSHYVAEFRRDESDAANVVQVWQDGTLQDDAAMWGHAISAPLDLGPLANDRLFFGHRDQLEDYQFVGNLDEFKIEDLAGGATIAEWKFDAGALLADSSGNGHDLENRGGASESTDGTNGSAYFDGTNGLVTQGNLDLSPYRHLMVTWSQRTEMTGLGITFEQTSDSNNHTEGAALLATVNELDADPDPELTDIQGCAQIKWPYPNANGDFLPHSTDGSWESFTMEINLDATTQEDVVILTRNGEVLEDTTPYESNKMPILPAAPPFINDNFFLGARGGGGLYYKGWLDEFTIETFDLPETPDLLPGDLNGDGMVGSADLDIVRGNWGSSVEAGLSPMRRPLRRRYGRERRPGHCPSELGSDGRRGGPGARDGAPVTDGRVFSVGDSMSLTAFV